MTAYLNPLSDGSMAFALYEGQDLVATGTTKPAGVPALLQRFTAKFPEIYSAAAIPGQPAGRIKLAPAGTDHAIRLASLSE